MVKQQINFRIDPELLQKIKDCARQQGISYTKWITNACISQINADSKITVDEEEEIDLFHPTAIHYSESNIQYSDNTLQNAIQDRDWEQTESEDNTLATNSPVPQSESIVFPSEHSLQAQINDLSNRLRWESQSRQALENQVYHLKSMLVNTVGQLEEKIELIEQRSNSEETV